MSWNEARSKRRIQEHLKTAPEFDDQVTLAKAARLLAEDRGLMSRLPVRRASVVEGAHLYGQLLDFEQVVADQNRVETKDSHQRVLQFLNMHYRLWDSIVGSDDADRVDYHGARLHAIITSPESDARGQLERAVALASKLAEATKRVADAYGFPARIRFGIDQGKCLTLSTGRAQERDILFFGAPANHAAKVAAASGIEGVFVASGAETLADPRNVRRTDIGDMALDSRFIAEASSRHTFTRLDEAVPRLTAEARQQTIFSFHRATPPLVDVKFAQLTPAYSIRMGMASLFADVDGFTAFVDAAVRNGSNAIKRAATAIHVIREELNDVLQEDSAGKRVRFIGDCIHGVLAEGRLDDDPPAAVDDAILCAAGMRDSFALCQQIVGGIDALGLAIGIEYGPVPLTRLGLRGKDSVRCAAGRAVVIAERVQQSIAGQGLALGPEARRFASPAASRLLASTSKILGYDATADLLGSVSSPAVSVVREDRTARPYVSR